MSSVSVCTTKACEVRFKCKRANPSGNIFWQSYFDWQPNPDGTCDGFIQMLHFKKESK